MMKVCKWDSSFDYIKKKTVMDARTYFDECAGDT